MRRGGFLARVSLLSLTVLIFLQVAGCADIRFRVGSQPKIEVLDQYLRIGESTREDVLAALGLPHGKGRAMLPFDEMLLSPDLRARLKTGRIVVRPRTLWSYYYEEGLVPATGEGDARRIFLFVFFDQDRYEGYMWFSSLRK